MTTPDIQEAREGLVWGYTTVRGPSTCQACTVWAACAIRSCTTYGFLAKKMQAQRSRLLRCEVHEYALFCTACQAGLALRLAFPSMAARLSSLSPRA